MQCRAVLEKLGYRILPKEADDQSPALSRDRIEAAMDAHEAFRENGAHADVFSGFGAPSEYWVRSTRPRQDKRFPTKPLIGFLLGRPASALTGGWSQPHDAAARLHAAGYIIVDQNDEPLPLPEQYAHLMRGADRARLVALNYFIAPAREAGQTTPPNRWSAGRRWGGSFAAAAGPGGLGGGRGNRSGFHHVTIPSAVCHAILGRN